MELADKLSDFVNKIGVDYAICGGHAIDLFVGEKTRPHKDSDVLVYWEDRDKIIRHMLNEGWDVYEPCGTPHLHKIESVVNQKRAKDNIWCVMPSNPHYNFTDHEKDMYAVSFDDSEQVELDFIEFLFNTAKDGCFLYKKNHEIKRCLDKTILKANGIPYLAPEVVLLYKSTAADSPDYQLDFDNATKKMNAEQMKWLQNALTVMFPDGHKWIC